MKPQSPPGPVTSLPPDTGGPFRIARTEFVWPGKYDERGTLVEPPQITLPFQAIEVVNEGRTSREALTQATLPLFATKPKGAAEDGWRNKLIWGENLYVLSSLVAELAGRVDLIYIDPPFATGADFSINTEIGDDDLKIHKEPSSIELKAYRDMWKDGKASFLGMLAQRLVLMRTLLSSRGMILVHLDDNVGHEVKLLMDEVFGAMNRRGEIIWQLGTGAKSRQFFSIQHNVIFAYSRSEDWVFNTEDPILREPYAKGSLATHFNNTDEHGRKYRSRTVNGKEYIYYADQGRMIGSVWTDVPSMTANSPIVAESTGYPTQKPEKLLHRLIVACSNPGDIIADFFCGSGTTLAVAERLGRRWVGCDLGRFAIHTSRKRLLELRVTDSMSGEARGARPFEILNLGRYERKYWQGITFGNEPKSDLQTALVAYVEFILALYKAEPIQGAHVHGRKGSALIHVGAVDAPVTIAQIEDAVAETMDRGIQELHVLAWEWEMGLYDPLTKLVKAQHGVDVRLLSIPREVMERRAVEAGDVQFFDLAYLEIEAQAGARGVGGTRSIKICLKDFVIPSTDLIPEEVRNKIRKWSDYIDYWAVDWDFRNDTFMSLWQSYRTRHERKLELESGVHTYSSQGTYQVLVKVVDIFGNDTSHLLKWEAE